MSRREIWGSHYQWKDQSIFGCWNWMHLTHLSNDSECLFFDRRKSHIGPGELFWQEVYRLMELILINLILFSGQDLGNYDGLQKFWRISVKEKHFWRILAHPCEFSFQAALHFPKASSWDIPHLSTKKYSFEAAILVGFIFSLKGCFKKIEWGRMIV